MANSPRLLLALAAASVLLSCIGCGNKATANDAADVKNGFENSKRTIDDVPPQHRERVKALMNAYKANPNQPPSAGAASAAPK